jgi:uncharacterized glyoxalase superfamily protein PhnB
MAEVSVRSVTPILFVSDVPATAAFFNDKLGFETDFLYGNPPFYGSVSRAGACLHLRFVHGPNRFSQQAAEEDSLILATIEVSDVKSLYEEFAGRGVAFSQPLEHQAWGGTDFHVRDPDGNAFSFVTYDDR